jgi:signal peptidase
MIHYLKFLLNFYLAAAVLAAIVWLAMWLGGFSLNSVQTSSMAPVLQPGDLAVSIKPSPDNLDVGDIITYKIASGASITHRIYALNPKQGTITSKGDNLAYPDPPIHLSQIQSKTVKAVPSAGALLDYLHRPLGLILLVYLPALFICAFQLQKLLGERYSRYDLQIG